MSLLANNKKMDTNKRKRSLSSFISDYHKKATQKFKWYEEWHKYNYQPHIHWAVLGVFFVALIAVLSFTYLTIPKAPIKAAGSLIRSSSGTLFRTDFPGTSLPSGLTGVTSGAGSIVVSGNTCTLNSAEGRAFIVPDTALPTDKVFVARIKFSPNAHRCLNLCLVQSVAQPDNSDASRDYYWANRTFLTLGEPGKSTDGWMYTNWNDSTADQLLYERIANDYYLQVTSDATNVTIKEYESNMTGPATSLYAWGSAQAPTPTVSLWPTVGGIYNAAFADTDITVYSFDIFLSHLITVTGLGTGNAVRLYNASDDSVLASAVESGGTATMDCTTVDWVGLEGYIK